MIEKYKNQIGKIKKIGHNVFLYGGFTLLGCIPASFVQVSLMKQISERHYKVKSIFPSFAFWQINSTVLGGVGAGAYDSYAGKEKNTRNFCGRAAFATLSETISTIAPELKTLNGGKGSMVQIAQIARKAGSAMALRNLLFWVSAFGSSDYSIKHNLSPAKTLGSSFIAGNICSFLTMPLVQGITLVPGNVENDLTVKEIIKKKFLESGGYGHFGTEESRGSILKQSGWKKALSLKSTGIPSLYQGVTKRSIILTIFAGAISWAEKIKESEESEESIKLI